MIADLEEEKILVAPSVAGDLSQQVRSNRTARIVASTSVPLSGQELPHERASINAKSDADQPNNSGGPLTATFHPGQPEEETKNEVKSPTGQGPVVVMGTEKDMFAAEFQMPSAD